MDTHELETCVMNRKLLIVFLIVLVIGAIVLVTRSHPGPAMQSPISPPTLAQPFERRNSLSLDCRRERREWPYVEW